MLQERAPRFAVIREKQDVMIAHYFVCRAGAVLPRGLARCTVTHAQFDFSVLQSPEQLFFAFPRDALLLVQGVQAPAELRALLLGAFGAGAGARLDAFLTLVGFVPFTALSRVPARLHNRTFVVLREPRAKPREHAAAHYRTQLWLLLAFA